MSKVLELLIRGTENQLRKGQEREKQALGTLRVGNSGLLTPSKDYVGSCPRLTYLRMVGTEVDPVTVQKELMFAAGRANEDIWKAALEASEEQGLVVRAEEEIPVSYILPSGKQVTGRPDLVLGRLDAAGNFLPERGLELKQVCSLWTARDVLFSAKPKMDHLLQAGHYAWKLGEQAGVLPGLAWGLWYTNRSNYAVPEFARRWMPKEGAPLSEYCTYNQKGECKSVEPFAVGYLLQWNQKGQLEYKQVGAPADSAWTRTIITKEGITAYYESIAGMDQTGALPPRPRNVGHNGESAGYSKCDYCVLAPTCSAHEGKGLQKWRDEVSRLTSART